MPNNLVLPKTGSKPGSKPVNRAGSKASRGSRPSSSSLSFAPAFATLALGKASRVFAAFVSFHYLQDRVALPLYLFFVTLGAAVCLLALQRPWNGKRIGSKRARRVGIAGAILAFTLYVWTAGLRSAGPLRTLLIDGAELPLLYLFAVAARRELPERRKTRGAVFMLLAYCLLIWDASGHAPDIADLEHSRLGQTAESTINRIANKTTENLSHIAALGKHDDGRPHRMPGSNGSARRRLLTVDDGADATANMHTLTEHLDADSDLPARVPAATGGWRRRLMATYKPPVAGSGGVRDAFVEGTALRCEIGVLLVLFASVLMQSSRAFTRRLATELGGAKRHFALSTTAACAWLTPLAALSWLSSSTGALLSLSVIGGITSITVSGTHVLGFVAVGFLWLVLPYYVRAIVSTALPQRTMVQSGVVIPFVMACITSIVFGAGASAGGISWILVAAFLLDCVGISLMMSGGVRRSLSELPLDTSGSSRSRGGVSAGGDSAHESR